MREIENFSKLLYRQIVSLAPHSPATQANRLKAVRKSKGQREISPNSLQPKQPVYFTD